MSTLLSLLTLLHVSIVIVHAYPPLGVDRLPGDSSSQLKPRQDIPKIPPKPETSGPGLFHSSQFELLEQTGYAPAVDAMPVWVYSRTQKDLVGQHWSILQLVTRGIQNVDGSHPIPLLMYETLRAQNLTRTLAQSSLRQR